MAEISINQEVCTRCGACVEICSVTHVFEMAEGEVRALNSRRCWECGQCVAVCPVDAIEHSRFPLEACPLIERHADGMDVLVNLMRERRSMRVYKQKPVEREAVEKLMEITRWAPSGSNLQQVAWQALDDAQAIARLEEDTVRSLVKQAAVLRKQADAVGLSEMQRKIALRQAKSYEHLERRLGRDEKPVFFGAPLLLFAVTPDTHFGRDDAVIAGYSMQLAATQMGLATCQVGYFVAARASDSELGGEMLNVESDHVVQMILAVGYPKYKMRRYVARDEQALTWLS